MTTPTQALIARIIERAHTVAASLAKIDPLAAAEALLEVLPLEMALTREQRRDGLTTARI